MNTTYLNEGNATTKMQETTRETCCQKNEQRWSKCICTHELWHLLPLYAAVRILDYPLPPNQVLFSTRQKSQQKSLNILRTKRTFKVKLKAFFINFKGLALNQWKQFFGRWKSTLMNGPWENFWKSLKIFGGEGQFSLKNELFFSKRVGNNCHLMIFPKIQNWCNGLYCHKPKVPYWVLMAS